MSPRTLARSGFDAGRTGLDAQAPTGVAIHPGHEPLDPHETGTLRVAATRVAAILGLEVCDAIAEARHFWIPASTLSNREAADLGIDRALQLWGGIVPFPFVATKLVSHPVWKDGNAPPGWTTIIGIEACTLPGYSVFSAGDAAEAGRALLREGEVRLKPPHARGGHGQVLLRNERELDRWLRSSDADLVGEGLVLERHLVRSSTRSVGSSDLAGRRIAYHGRQREVRGPDGAMAYGGSTLEVFRGDMAAMRATLPAGPAADAVEVAMRYDHLLRDAYGVQATRCNYDVIAGVDSKERHHLGVLEQSWRFGGASMAEVLAIERFEAVPGLEWLVAETVESYSDEAAPPDAVACWPGGDGTPHKYARIVRHGH